MNFKKKREISSDIVSAPQTFTVHFNILAFAKNIPNTVVMDINGINGFD